MNARIHRLASRRSVTRFLSIVAIAVGAFAALELLTVQHAFAATKCCTKNSLGQFTTNCYCDSALPCNTGFSSTGLTCPLPYTTSTSTSSSGGTINSTISCTGLTGQGQNNVDFATVSQTAITQCTVSGTTGGTHNGTAFCQLDLSYSRPNGLTTPGVQQCVPEPGGASSTLTDVTFCDQVSGGAVSDKLVVAGTLKCGRDLNGGDLPTICGNEECTLNLGVKGGACSTVFPATTGLAAGQVLGVFAKVEGPSCSGPIIEFGQIQTRYCSGPSFDGSAVDCKFGAVVATTRTTTTPAIPFNVDFSPQTLNVTCNNNDVWRFTIFGNENLDVNQINESSLRVEGYAGVTCGDAVGNSLTCDVAACQSFADQVPQQLGRFVAGHRNADGTFDLTVTGTLDSGTAIHGEEHVKTSGQ